MTSLYGVTGAIVQERHSKLGRGRSHYRTNLPSVDPCLLCLVVFQTRNGELNVILWHHTMASHPFAFLMSYCNTIQWRHTLWPYHSKVNVRFCSSNTVTTWVVAVSNVRSEEIWYQVYGDWGQRIMTRIDGTDSREWLMVKLYVIPFETDACFLLEVAGYPTSYTCLIWRV